MAMELNKPMDMEYSSIYGVVETMPHRTFLRLYKQGFYQWGSHKVLSYVAGINVVITEVEYYLFDLQNTVKS